MLCGKSLFHFWELEVIPRDIDTVPEPGNPTSIVQQRREELGARGRPSLYFDVISSNIIGRSEPIWELVWTFSTHYCSDPRDRVFGLLALADSESREAFSPDYTKSATAVLLQLIEHHAKVDKGHDSKVNFYWAHNIIGAFGLGPDNPEIAPMRDRRRIAVHRQDPFSGTRDTWPPCIQKDNPRSFDRLPRPDVATQPTAHRIVLGAESHCTVWQNGAGEFVAPLWRMDTAFNSVQHDFSAGQGDTATCIRLHTPDGSVIGLANKRIKHGDTILLFESGNDNGVFHSALIVRRCDDGHDPTIATIVGQCIVHSNVKSCLGGSGCVCGHVTHVSAKEVWNVLMSPEDLLVFIAQDLKLVHRQPSKFEVPMVDYSVHLEESRERLTTGVTSEEFSSYATVTPSAY
jgi:hypothetical protein